MMEYLKQAKEIIGLGVILLGAAFWIYTLRNDVDRLNKIIENDIVQRNEMRCFQYQLEKFNTGLKVPDIDEISGKIK